MSVDTEVNRNSLRPQAALLAAQRHILRSNLFFGATEFIVAGSMMLLYANDVLHFSASRIAAVLSMTPLLAVLRFLFLPLSRRMGFVPNLLAFGLLRVGLIGVIAATPARHLTYPLFISLILLYGLATQLGFGTVWQPMIRQVTNRDERGDFFSRMRFSFSTITVLVSILASIFIGSSITEIQYKGLLALAMAGQLNHVFWLWRMPKGIAEAPAAPANARGVWKSIVAALRSSRLLRRPLVIPILLAFAGLPLFVLYLRTVINVPSNLIAWYLVAANVAATLSFLFWGRVADTVGFKPMLIGLQIISMALAPLILLVTPLAPGAALAGPKLFSLAALFVSGTLAGSLGAGLGIVMTNILHYYVRRSEALEAMNLYALAVVAFQALATMASGWLVDRVGNSSGSILFGRGFFHLDWVKAWLVLGAPLLQLAVIWNTLRLPVPRRHFGAADFFASMNRAALKIKPDPSSETPRA